MARKVLVVDDSLVIRQLVSKALTGAGFETLRGKSAGAKGWLVKPFKADALLLAMETLAREPLGAAS